MKENKSISFKEYLNIAFWSIKVNFKIHPFFATCLFLTGIIRQLRTIANIYVISRLIDRLVYMAQDTTNIEDLIPYLLILLAINFFFTITEDLYGHSSRAIVRLGRPYLEKMQFEKINYLGTQTLELPKIANLHQKADDWLFSTIDMTYTVLNMLSFLIRTLVTGIVLFFTIPFVLIIILILSIIFFIQRKQHFTRIFNWYDKAENLEGRKKTHSTSNRIRDPKSLGEISIIGAFTFLQKKYTNFYDYFNAEVLKIMKKDFTSRFFLSLMSSLTFLYGYIRIFSLLLNNKISIGDTTFFMITINDFHGAIQGFFEESAKFRDFVVRTKEVYRFFTLEPAIKDGEIEIERFKEAPLIEIKNISFHYPNDKRYVLKNFSLKIDPGEKLAVVGENGAGKTTLVKLLCRIYDPQEGKILINGVNLKDIKIDDWYKNIGVLFQDFNFYEELTAEENIYLGRSIKKIEKGKVVEAAKNADAHDFIMEYKNKYQTIMSERIKGGIRPSNGQKQKISIARFFYRNAPFAIFDEPTSAIDAESEYKIFNRIYKFFKNKSVLIISHRFSTVRNADRIIVLHKGQIVEKGTHSELLKRKGKYAKAFEKQAKGYKNKD